MKDLLLMYKAYLLTINAHDSELTLLNNQLVTMYKTSIKVTLYHDKSGTLIT